MPNVLFDYSHKFGLANAPILHLLHSILLFHDIWVFDRKVSVRFQSILQFYDYDNLRPQPEDHDHSLSVSEHDLGPFKQV